MAKRKGLKQNKAKNKTFLASGILLLIIIAEVASDMGDGIVALFNLSGIKEAGLWFTIVGIVSGIA